jgi:hypothetical protein
MPNRELSASAVLFAFGLCLTLNVSACSSDADGTGGSEPIREQTETDRTQSPVHQERMREERDQNGGGGY